MSDLLEGIRDDVVAILESFAGGPDDPRSPLTDSAALKDDRARLEAATRKAERLRQVLESMRDEGADLGR